MNKVLEIINNVWFKRGVSVLSLVYMGFVAFMGWLSMAYFMEPEHESSLFLLYLFINLLFGGLMFFSRKQLLTQLSAMLTPVFAFIILIFSFGNWYFIVPPIVICVAIFFLCGAGETVKTVLGTIYLIMYVIGILVYLTIDELFGSISLVDTDPTERSKEYLVSPNEEYRIVKYIDDDNDNNVDRKTIKCYVEKTADDVFLPFVKFRYIIGAQHIVTSVFDKPAKVEWKAPDKLYVDGRAREFSFEERTDDEESSESKDETTSKTSKPNTSESNTSVAGTTAEATEAD